MRAFTSRLPISLRRLISRLRHRIHTDVLAWRQEAHQCARADRFFFYFPPTPKITNRFSISFLLKKMRRSSSGKYWKACKNQEISLFDIYEKHEGRAKSAPSPARFPDAGWGVSADDPAAFRQTFALSYTKLCIGCKEIASDMTHVVSPHIKHSLGPLTLGSWWGHVFMKSLANCHDTFTFSQ